MAAGAELEAQMHPSAAGPAPSVTGQPGEALPVVAAVIERLTQLAETHAAPIAAAAQLFARCIRQGGLIHVFGAGHSHLLAEELFFRAGGLLSFNALLDPGLMLHESAVAAGELERIAEYAAIVLGKYPMSAADALLVISYSGINPVPVEVARLAKARSLPVVALTSVEASRGSPARHPSGQRLYEVADLVLDNPGPVGDASLRLPGLETPLCALSTILGAAIAQSLVYATAAALHSQGHPLPLLRSGNAPGGDSLNTQLVTAYRRRLRHL
ncbi:MAG: SIS domain-containing protein [Caldilineaceae bacterium]|nr:SIS domain-containing protein [Caldilineaceae bacterium]